MPDQTILDFLGGQRLTEVAQSEAIKRGVPRALPEALYAPSLSKPSTDQVEYIAYNGLREGARLVARSSPARARNLPGATRKFATAISVKELMAIDTPMLDALKNSNPVISQGARRELVKRMADFNGLFETTRTGAVVSAFAKGGVWADANGVLQASSSNAAVSIDYGVATANQITKNGSGGTYNIGDWSDAGATIGLNLRALRNANVKQNNYMLDTILYGTNVPDYLAKNTTLKEYFSRNGIFRDTIVQNNEIPDGTLGFNWVPVGQSYYIDSSGVAQPWFDDKFIGVMPAIEDSWYEFIEGGSLVPTGIATAGASLEQALSGVTSANGKYAYIEQSTNPMAINLIQGDSFLPIIKVPGTYYFGTCA